MDKKFKLLNKHVINANGVQLTFCIEGETTINRFVNAQVASAFTVGDSYTASTVLGS